MTETLRVLLVDDEAPARARLARLIARCEGVELVGECQDGASALTHCQAVNPDLVLLDVEMPEQDGMSVARKLFKQPGAPAIIFVTAFEQYAVDAFDVRAADYLVKPVRQERLLEALQRVRGRPAAAPVTSEPMLVARLADRITRIPLPEIRALIAEDKYVSVHSVSGVALVEESLVQLEQRFGSRFLRIHRNALVARVHLRSLFRDPQGAERVEIDDIDVHPEVSRRNLPAVRRVLKGTT